MNLAVFSICYLITGLLITGYIWPDKDELDDESEWFRLNWWTFILGVLLWPLLIGAYFKEDK